MNRPDTPKDPIAQAFQTPFSAPQPNAKQQAIQAAMAAFREEKAEQSQANTTASKKSTPLTPKTLSQFLLIWLQGFSNSLRLRFENFINPIGDWIMNKQLLVGGSLASACAIVVSIVLFAPDRSPTSAPQAPPATDITTPTTPELEKSPLAQSMDASQSADKANTPEVARQRDDQAPAASDTANRTRLKSSEEALVVAEPTIDTHKITEHKKITRSEKQEALSLTDNLKAKAPSDLMQGAAEGPSMMGFTANKSLAVAKIGIQPPDIRPPRDTHAKGNDEFAKIDTNPVKLASEAPISTFSADVDTASYSFARRQLTHGVMPQKDAVRAEELINYFDYDYPLPTNKNQPFKPTIVVTDSPWKTGNKLIHIGIKGYDITPKTPPKANLVFLLDVSGSMRSADKLPLVKQSMELLLSQLNPEDTVSIVVYAGQSGTALEPTPAKEKQKIIDAMTQLNASGGTAGAEGIKRAYELAEANFVTKGINRIFLATDGDFNLGIHNHEELKGFVERKREKGIFLSVLGFGQGNYHDNLMQTLAQNGNGIAAYIDTLGEAQKVLVEEASSALFPIAKDVKLQVEFNPATVKEYRLIGYETRALKREDFNNDAVDAGDIGSGHTVTAIYEITPVGSDSGLMEPKRYGKAEKPTTHGHRSEYGFLKIRYKQPDQSHSQLIEAPISMSHKTLPSVLQQEVEFATAVAGFAQLLRDGKYIGDWSYDDAIKLAHKNKGEDFYGYRTEFVQLIRKAKIAKSM